MRHFSVRDPLVKIFVIVFVGAGVLFMERLPTSTSSTSAWSTAAWRAASSATRPRCTRDLAWLPSARSWTRRKLRADLRRAGYTEGSSDGGSAVGHYTFTRGGIEIVPGPQSFHASNTAAIRFSGGKIASITESGDDAPEPAGL